MGRRAKPAKVKAKAKRPLARKAPTMGAARVHELERLRQALLEQQTATGALLQEKNRALTEALEQQTATAEILRVISESPTDVQPVFDTIVSNAVRLCEAIYGTVGLVEGDVIVLAAQYNFGREDTDVVRQAYPVPLSSDAPVPRSVRTGSVYRSADVESEPEWQARTEEMRATLRRRGVRSHLAVPMLRRGQAIGVINLTHREVSAFTDAHVELLKTFADQAVIAVENVRLFTELEEKNAALTQSLEQQTATGEILTAISASPTDVHPVFDAIVESAVRLCDARYGAVFRYDGELLHLAAHHNFSEAGLSGTREQYPMRPSRAHISGRSILTGATLQIPDIALDAEYGSALATRLGFRSLLAVPILRGGAAIGSIVIYRMESGPFAEKQVGLLQTFADQAVIAIENVRLFTELQASNRELTTALDTQTATSDILRVISRAQTNVQPVFDAILISAVRLLRGYSGVVTRIAGDQIELAALTSADAAADAAVRTLFPRSLQTEGLHAQTIRDRAPLNIADAHTDPRLSEAWHVDARVRGFRSGAIVPLLRHDEAVGTIGVSRRDPGGFTDDEIALLQTFADQAVIAIENARLLSELQERNRAVTEALERQTATGEILRVIGSSPTDVQPVFETIARSGVSVCGAHSCAVFVVDDDMLRLAATCGVPPKRLERFRDQYPVSLSAEDQVADAVRGRRVFHLADIEHNPDATAADLENAHLGEYRTRLMVPMVRGNAALGLIAVTREAPTPFSDEQVDLLKTFGDQAVIAIENVRLFTELQTSNRELTTALDTQTATADILRVISLSQTDVQPVFDTIMNSAARLCDGDYACVLRLIDGNVHMVADTANVSVGWAARTAFAYPRPLNPEVNAGDTAIAERRVVHIPDLEAEHPFKGARELARTMGYRGVVFVPMIREGVAIGAIAVVRNDVNGFGDKQIQLLQTFADQAVIAIENVRLFTELQTSNRELTSALDTQTATADILRVISGSRTDVQPVFDAIVASAVRLLGAYGGALTRVAGDQIVLVALTSPDDAGAAAVRSTFPQSRQSEEPHALAIRDRVPLNFAEAHTDPRVPEAVHAYARARGFRSAVVVPLLRRDEAIGAIGVTRREAGGFTDDEIALLKTFADQAVIAIENARLLSELQTSNRELTQAHAQVSEALEQQTTTSEILRVISSSPTDVQPVFDAIVESALLLCDGYGTALFRFDGAQLALVTLKGRPDFLAGRDAFARVFPLPPDGAGLLGVAAAEGQLVSSPDILSDPRVGPRAAELARASGYQSMLHVPLMRDGVTLGVLTILKAETGPFPARQIGLLKTFADQAVIAIENVRLFTELEASNRELTTALDTQTATSDILRVISRSQTDVQPVFDAIVASAVRLLRGYTGALTRLAGDQIELAAVKGYDDAADAAARPFFPLSLHSEGAHARAICDRMPLNIADAHTDPRMSEAGRALARARGHRSQVVVPLLLHDEAVGTIAVTRREPGGFNDDEIALLQTFADQAVIAIENARLLSELQARTQELTQSVDTLTALGEVGQAISSTLDLQTVLRTIVARATQLADADAGVIYEYDEQREVFEPRATERLEDDIVQTLVATPVRKGQGATGRLAEVREPIQLADLRVLGEQIPVRDSLIRAGYRALLAVPLVREDHLIGGLTVFRKTPGEFAADIVDLLKTFATQSSLAIQNARLFREIAQKSRELEVASQHKSEFLASMSHELRTPLNAIIGFSDVLLQGMFGEMSEKQTEYLQDILASGQHLLSLINDILDLSKIEAGRMELDVAAFDLPTAIDDALLLMRERASRRGITLERHVDERLGAIRADQRKFKQVLLNLLSNAVKFTPEGGRIDVRADLANGTAEISVTDTGIGIAPEDHDAVFEEFRQVGAADKKAEGTGLGLALCRKFVELHGGRIWVKSQIGAGSTFTFTIPFKRAAMGEN